MATFRLNSHDFESAVLLWDAVEERLPRTSVELRAYVKAQKEYTWLGLYSTRRDKSYGEGNIREALSWTLKQRQIARTSARFAHDLATLFDVLGEAEKADASYYESQRLAVQAAARQADCSSWSLAPPQNEHGPAKVHKYGVDFESVGRPRIEIVENALLVGPDYIIARLTHHEGKCEQLEVVGVDRHAELHIAFDQPPPETWPEAAFAIPFAATNYYHFITDVLPRVVVLATHRVPILVPELPEKHVSLLRLAAPNTSIREMPRLPAVHGPRLRVHKLLTLSFARVLASRPTHALTPPPLLQAARSAVLNRLPPPESSSVVVYASRKNATLRQFANESLLLQLLPGAVHFDGTQRDILSAVAIFRSASVVVGVHGAALANSLWCQPTALLIELGFDNAAARHYEHLAAAVGISYKRVLLAPDERTFAAPVVVRILYCYRSHSMTAETGCDDGRNR